MSTIKVSAEHTYEILIDVDWKSELTRLLVGRTRAALIVSEAMQSRVAELNVGDTELLTFPVPDGEGGKSSATLLQVWNWLGAAGFTQTMWSLRWVVGLRQILGDLPRHLGYAELIG